MNFFLNTTKTVLGTAAMAVIFATGAYAGDLYGAGPGGYKDGVGGIPVPAPIPVPDYTARYYFRMDAAYGWNDASALSTSYSVPNAGYSDLLRWDDGLSEFGRYGIGFGMYVNSYFRADMTFEMRNEYGGDTVVNNQLDQSNPNFDWERTTRDEIKVRDSLMMLNAYVDVPVSTRFRPYVGAGVGAAVHRYQRNFSNLVNCTALNLGATDCNPDQLGDQGTGTIASVDGDDKDWTFGFAGALMAGAVWDMTDNWKLDIGYRFLHLSSVDFTQRLNGTADGSSSNLSSTVTIPDQNIHELRVGLRYDIQ